MDLMVRDQDSAPTQLEGPQATDVQVWLVGGVQAALVGPRLRSRGLGGGLGFAKSLSAGERCAEHASCPAQPFQKVPRQAHCRSGVLCHLLEKPRVACRRTKALLLPGDLDQA